MDAMDDAPELVELDSRFIDAFRLRKRRVISTKE
jgi:hypothetical protein